MATSFKLYSAASTDGAVYIDLPISGRIASISFNQRLVAGAGGVAHSVAEISRVAVNQYAITNPRGVISSSVAVTYGASNGTQTNYVTFPDEPVKSGERLYLNCAAAANDATNQNTAFITIV